MYSIIEYTLYNKPPAAWDYGYAEWILQGEDNIQMHIRALGTVIGTRKTKTPNYTYYKYLYIPKDDKGTFDDLEVAKLAFELDETHD